jgi:hypothetical protein
VIDELMAFMRDRLGGEVALNIETETQLPTGWQIITRKWGPRHYDAIIVAPYPLIGWRLAGDFARTSAEAVKRASAEIRDSLRRAEERTDG